MYRQSGKKLLNSNISSTSPCSVVNFDPLTAEIGWQVWGTPANFNGFRIGTLYIHFWGLLHPNGILPAAKIHFASKSCILLYWQRYCTALEYSASAKRCHVVQGMELWNFRSSSFWTLGTTGIPRAAITLGIGPHSS